MRNLSFWEFESYFKNIDVAIVGAGIVGLNAALELKKSDKRLKIIVLERGVLPDGASTKNAGFACFGSCSELLDDLTKMSQDDVCALVTKRWKGLKKLRSVVGDKNLDLKAYGGYEVFKDESSFETCREKFEEMNKLLSPIIENKEVFTIADKKIKALGLANVSHLIFNSAEAQIDTGKMMMALYQKVIRSGVIVLNNCLVGNLSNLGNKASFTINDSEPFETKKVLVTTNGFAKQLLPELPVNPARAQVLITSEIEGLKLKGTFHYDKGYYYFRNIGKRVLLGGARNIDFRGEETTEFGLTQQIQDNLEGMLREVILSKHTYTIEQRWSGIMGVGEEKKPIVKPISSAVFCAVRMGGMGVAIGSLVGEEASAMLLSH